MQKILSIISKDLKVRFTSLSEWLFFLVLPVVFTVVLAGGTSGPADSRVRLLVADQAQTQLSAQVIDALVRSDVVHAELLPLAEAEEQFSDRAAAALLVIPAGFDQDQLLEGQAQLELRQQPNSTDALLAGQAVSGAVNQVSSVFNIASKATREAAGIRAFASETERAAYFNAALQAVETQSGAAPDYYTVARGATEDPIDYEPRAASSAGQLITWVFIPLLGISAMFAYERQRGTLRRLIITPTQRSTFLIGTISGQVLAALVQMALLIGFGVLVMQLNWGHSPLALALIMVSSALAAAAMGTAMGAFIKSEGQANGLSITAGMVMALMGGCWYPLELFPTFVQDAVRILPTRWAMQGMLDLVQRGQGLEGVLPEAAVLLGFAVVFFAVGVARFRYE